MIHKALNSIFVIIFQVNVTSKEKEKTLNNYEKIDNEEETSDIWDTDSCSDTNEDSGFEYDFEESGFEYGFVIT